MTPHPLSLIPALADRRVLIVGDLVLDEYLIGRVSRLSREAPVPVLEQTRAHYVLGGAANPAANVRSLGSRAMIAGVVGDDPAGRQLREMLARAGIDLTGVITDPTRPTTQKTRIVAEGAYVFAHHLARVDRLSRAPLAGDRERHLCDRIATLASRVDAILVSDYGLGVLTPRVVDTVRESMERWGVITTVDTQGNLDAFRGFDLLRCNAQEAGSYLGRPLRSDSDFEAALHELVTTLDARSAIITRGAEGVSCITPQGEMAHLPASNRTQVFDVTGAGDTFIATVTLALAAGLDVITAADLGNRAAGVAVTRLGNVAVRPEEISRGHERPRPRG